MGISTPLAVDSKIASIYRPPPVVMQSAGTTENTSTSLDFFLDITDSSLKFYVYFHFAELQKLEANQTREFNISFNGDNWFGPLRPEYLSSDTIITPTALDTGGNYSFSIYSTESSTLPPILNALEVYSVVEFLQFETDKSDGM